MDCTVPTSTGACLEHMGTVMNHMATNLEYVGTNNLEHMDLEHMGAHTLQCMGLEQWVPKIWNLWGLALGAGIE
ncbi:hypothetical protein ACRRTK_020500 [Alexandromys fortis]